MHPSRKVCLSKAACTDRRIDPKDAIGRRGAEEQVARHAVLIGFDDVADAADRVDHPHTPKIPAR